MRILYLTPLYLPWQGGLEILCHSLLLELRRRGHQVAVVTSADDGAAPLGVDEVDEVPVLRALVHREALSPDPRQLLLAQRRVREFVDIVQPDVTHCHEPGLLLWLYQHVAGGRAPVVTTLHNVVRRQWPGELNALGGLLEQSDWVTGVSRDALGDALSFAPGRAGRSSVIENGVPEAGAAEPVADGPARLLCLGRLVHQKAFDRAVDAFAHVVARHPEATLDIAGEGSHHTRLVDQVERLGLAASVTLRGRVEHADVARLLQDCTALLVPSRFEGLPLVALEAGHARRPVVGTDVPGLREAVVHEETGFLVDEDDPEALVDAVLRVVEDRELARRLGDGGLAKARREHSLAACADAYEELYKRVTDGPRL